MFVPLRFAPGINRETTNYTNEGGWWDCNLVRFRMGHPETIGGWQKYVNAQFVGTCRSMNSWVSLSGNVYNTLGTNLKYQLESGGFIFDITPIRETTAAGAVVFSATASSDVLDVADTSHGLSVGDYVTFSGAVSLGGNVIADELNKEFTVTSVVDADNYTVTLAVTANGSDTGNGGGSVVGTYQIPIGSNASVFGGWGIGGWGAGPWGSGTFSVAAVARRWSQDNFGEDLVFCTHPGGIFYWDASGGTASPGVALSDLSGATSAPTMARTVIVSEVDRHVIVFGTDDEFSPGTFDPLLIRFSDQESITDWATTTTNTAGSLRINGGTEIITAVQTRREILVFTDESVHVMQFLGPPYTFGINEVASDVHIVSAGSVVAVNDAVFWMASGKFMSYSGVVSEIPCTVKEYVFSNMNYDEVTKVSAGHNSEFSEVWWFYPSASSTEVDKYVIYNYESNLWYYGELVRTAWMSRGFGRKPLAAGADGYIYSHEDGVADGSTSPAGALTPFIESRFYDLDQGWQFFFATKAIPDINFRSSTNLTPQVTMTINATKTPGGAISDTDSVVTHGSVSLAVDRHTEQLPIRLRGRAYSCRYESSDTGNSWRIGTPRLLVRTDGRK